MTNNTQHTKITMKREELLEKLYDMARQMRVEIIDDEYGKLTVVFYPQEETL